MGRLQQAGVQAPAEVVPPHPRPPRHVRAVLVPGNEVRPPYLDLERPCRGGGGSIPTPPSPIQERFGGWRGGNAPPPPPGVWAPFHPSLSGPPGCRWYHSTTAARALLFPRGAFSILRSFIENTALFSIEPTEGSNGHPPGRLLFEPGGGEESGWDPPRVGVPRGGGPGDPNIEVPTKKKKSASGPAATKTHIQIQITY